jgi:hypothetical protein
VGESLSRQSAEPSSAASDTLDEWIKSVGETAAPVLAGFSFTVVIVVSDDAGHFRWPGAAIFALTIAAIALIAAFQCAKYARDKRWSGADRARTSAWWTPLFGKYFSLPPEERTEIWRKQTRRFYHLGITALLAGLALTLAPQHVAGGQEILRWAASGIAFAACAIESAVFLTAGRHDMPTGDQAQAPQPIISEGTSRLRQGPGEAAE